MTARMTILCFALLAGSAIPAPAQQPAETPASPMPTAVAPTIRDEGRYWSDPEKVKMNKTIADLFRRYRCQVIVESYPKEPNTWASGADLDDQAALGRALDLVRNKRFDAVRLQDKTCPCVVIIGGPGRYSWIIGFPNLTREEQHKVLNGIRERVISNGNSLSRGLPDVLAFIDEACQGRVAPPPNPAIAAFKSAAAAGGLSGPDLDAVLAARGSASYEALTDFAKDQIKEGRKGKDLRDDLLTFITFLNEKKK